MSHNNQVHTWKDQLKVDQHPAVSQEVSEIYGKVRNLPDSLKQEFEALKLEAFGLNERYPLQAAWKELVRRYPDITSQERVSFENDHEPIAHLKMNGGY